jgi:hopanoid biosynthesis associated protein HpnK
VRRLILNADDFGITRGVNRAILESHRTGVLTSATLMANAGAWSEAVQLAQENPKLGVGCHVVLVDGAPVTDPARLATLVTGSGEFSRSIGVLARRTLFGRIHPNEVEFEATAQFQKLQKAGVTLTHFDSHKHAHLFPALLEPMLRAARACGIRAVRNPFEPLHPLTTEFLRKRPGLWKRFVQAKLLRELQPAFRRLVARAGLRTTSGTIGIIVTGELDEQVLEQLITGMPEGTWELVCHPGYDDEELHAIRTRLWRSREIERQALMSPETRRMLEQKGVELISYRELES